MHKIKKEIIHNIFNYGLIEIISLLIPIITLPLLTRNLGGDVYGKYLLFMTMMIFSNTIIDYGVQYVGVRRVAKERDSINKIKLIYEELQGLRFGFGFLYFFCAILYALFFLNNNELEKIYLFSPFYIVGYILTSGWFFQAVGNTKPFMIVSLMARISNLVIIVFFIKDSSDIVYLYASSTIPIFISGVTLFIVVRNKYDVRMLSFNNLKDNIIIGGRVFVGILTPNLYNSLPAIVMGSVYNSSQFALFIIGTRICSIIGILQSVLSRSCYSFLAISNKSHVKKLIIANLLISLPIVIAFLFYGEELLTFFLGEGYANNIYLNILLIGMIFLGISNSISEGYLLPNGYDVLYRNISIIVSVISFFSAIILIYNFGLLGGAITLTFARVLYSILYSLLYFKLKNNI